MTENTTQAAECLSQLMQELEAWWVLRGFYNEQ